MRTFKLLAALAFVFVCSANILASRGGVSDKVFYEGVSYPMSVGFPMEQYFAEYPEKNRPKPMNNIVTPTGFIATFEFIGNDLYLKDYQMIVGFGTPGESLMPKLFPNGEKLKISWLSKPVIFGLGKGVLNERKTAYIFPSYLVLDLKNGEIQSKRETTHEEYQKYLKERLADRSPSTTSSPAPFIADLKLSVAATAAENAKSGQQEKIELSVLENAMVNVLTAASDPEGDFLTYEYEISGGKIVGKGAKVIWDLTGLKAGSYTIKVAVDDGCGICGNTVTKTVTIKE